MKLADFGLARSVAMMKQQEISNPNPILTDYVATRWYRYGCRRDCYPRDAQPQLVRWGSAAAVVAPAEAPCVNMPHPLPCVDLLQGARDPAWVDAVHLRRGHVVQR